MIQCPHCYWIIQDDGMPADDLIKMRDGEVVLYKRSDSDIWQSRYRTPDRKWHRLSTKRIRIADAKAIACEIYDKARFLNSQGLVSVSRRFRDVAKLTIQRMDQATEAGQSVFHCHIHLIPRRVGDVEHPRGGVRNLMPGRGNY